MEQQLIFEEKPKFTALQNIQNLFQDYPVITHEKHRIKLDVIQKKQYDGADLFR